MENKHSEDSNRRSPRRGRKAFLIVGIVALVLLAAVIGYAVWERPPEIVTPTPIPTSTPAPTPVPTQKPDDPELPTETPEPTPEPVDPFANLEVEPLITDREEGAARC